MAACCTSKDLKQSACIALTVVHLRDLLDRVIGSDGSLRIHAWCFRVSSSSHIHPASRPSGLPRSLPRPRHTKQSTSHAPSGYTKTVAAIQDTQLAMCSSQGHHRGGARGSRRDGRCSVCAQGSTNNIPLYQVQWGEVMKLVGGHSSIGDWTADRAAGMGWNDGHIWRTVLDLPAGQQVEFKVAWSMFHVVVTPATLSPHSSSRLASSKCSGRVATTACSWCVFCSCNTTKVLS